MRAHDLDLSELAVFVGTLLVVLGGLWWMLRFNARDLVRLEHELKVSLPCQEPGGTTDDE